MDERLQRARREALRDPEDPASAQARAREDARAGDPAALRRQRADALLCEERWQDLDPKTRRRSLSIRACHRCGHCVHFAADEEELIWQLERGRHSAIPEGRWPSLRPAVIAWLERNREIDPALLCIVQRPPRLIDRARDLVDAMEATAKTPGAITFEQRFLIPVLGPSQGAEVLEDPAFFILTDSRIAACHRIDGNIVFVISSARHLEDLERASSLSDPRLPAGQVWGGRLADETAFAAFLRDFISGKDLVDISVSCSDRTRSDP